MKSIFSLIFIISTTFSFGQITIYSGLVAFYPFCESTLDFSNNDNDGIIYGDVTFVEDRFGNTNSACKFDGIADFIQVNNSNSLQDIENELTLSLWVYTEFYDNSWSVWLSKSDISLAHSEQYAVYYRNNSGLFFNGLVTDNQVLEINNWYHIAVTYSDLTSNFYINGELIGSEFLADGITQNELPLDIGRHVPGEVEFFHGLMDDIRIYNRALSSEEITLLFSTNFDCNTNSITPALENQHIKAYPNPVHNTITINFKSPKRIEIYNSLGKLLVKENLQSSNNTIDLTRLASGVYILVIKANGSIYTQKIIKFK